MVEKQVSFYYGWVIVAVSFFTLFFTLGIRYSFAVFYVAILNEYGWGRAETAGVFSLAMVSHALFAMVTGNLIDRYGPRALFPLGATFLAIGLAAASQVTAIWHLYLFFGVAVAMGINTLSFGPHMSLIPKWFVRKRGLASGLVLAGTGLGIMVMVPVVQFMIGTIGWRSAFLVLAIMVVGLVVPMTGLLQRRSPEDVGQYPDGIASDSGGIHSSQLEGFPKDIRFSWVSEEPTLRRVLSTRSYWWLASVNFTAGFSNNMLLVHQAAHVVDAGYTPGLAALLVGFVGLLRSAGAVSCGYLSDRLGREIAYTFGSSSALLGILFLLSVRDTMSPWVLFAFLIFFGVGHGSMGAIAAAKAGDLFQGRSLGRIMSTFSIGFGFGGALGPYLGGYFHDQVGSYTFPFILAMGSFILGILGIWMAAPRPQRT